MMQWIISSCVLILAVVLLRQLLKGHISLRLQYALWALVLVRLLVPVQLGSSAMSVMNAARTEPVSAAAEAVSQLQVPTQTLRDSALTYEEALTAGNGTLHRVEGYSAQSGKGDLHTYSYTDSLGAVAQRVLPIVWIVGMTVTALVLIACNLSFARRLRRARRRTEIVSCRLAVYVSPAVETPCLFGLVRPAIYLTPDVAEDESALPHVLAHEWTHYRHGDHIWALLRSVCLAVHWYNPLVWWAVKLSRQDAELACDEGAIRRIGEAGRADYGRTLIGLSTGRAGAGLLLHATTMTGGKRSLKERIALIARKPKTAVITLVAVVLIAATALVCTFTGALNKKPQLRCVSVDGDGAVYELEFGDEIKGASVSIEQWYNGVCVWSQTRNEAELTKLHIRNGDLERDSCSINVTLTTPSGERDVPFYASFLQPFEAHAMSYDAYLETDWSHPIAAGEEYILSVVLFDGPLSGKLFTAWNCQNFMDDPGDMTRVPCMLLVRLRLLDEAPSPESESYMEDWAYAPGFDLEEPAEEPEAAGPPAEQTPAEPQPEPTDPNALTPEEIAWFNTGFFDREQNPMHLSMLTSEYQSVAEIDLYALFRQGAGERSTVSEEERAQLTVLTPLAEYLDISKTTPAQMDAVLLQCAGIMLEQTQKIGLDAFYYLEDYGAYYHVHGDTNRPGAHVVSGIRGEDGLLTLRYEIYSGRWPEDVCGTGTILLRDAGDRYLFVAHQLD